MQSRERIRESQATKEEQQTTNKNQLTTPTFFKWNKSGFSDIQKGAKAGVLELQFGSRSCYYHLYLDNKIKEALTKNSDLLQKTEELIADPALSQGGHQGIILTKDYADNTFVKLKFAGEGKGNGARIWGHVVDSIEDDVGDKHYAIDLSNIKFKHG